MTLPIAYTLSISAFMRLVHSSNVAQESELSLQDLEDDVVRLKNQHQDWKQKIAKLEVEYPKAHGLSDLYSRKLDVLAHTFENQIVDQEMKEMIRELVSFQKENAQLEDELRKATSSMQRREHHDQCDRFQVRFLVLWKEFLLFLFGIYLNVIVCFFSIIWLYKPIETDSSLDVISHQAQGYASDSLHSDGAEKTVNNNMNAVTVKKEPQDDVNSVIVKKEPQDDYDLKGVTVKKEYILNGFQVKTEPQDDYNMNDVVVETQLQDNYDMNGVLVKNEPPDERDMNRANSISVGSRVIVRTVNRSQNFTGQVLEMYSAYKTVRVRLDNDGKEYVIESKVLLPVELRDSDSEKDKVMFSKCQKYIFSLEKS